MSGPTGRLRPILPVSAGLLLILSATPDARALELFHSGPAPWVGRIDDAPTDRAPAIFGDGFVGLQDFVLEGDVPLLANSDVPYAGGFERMLIATNNSPQVRRRVYFNYDHVAGAYDTASNFLMPATATSHQLDRYVFGWEQPVFGGALSIEVRLPFASETTIGDANSSISNTSTIGDLGIIAKAMLLNTETTVISTGVGLQLPTGADLAGTDGTRTFLIDHDALYVSPFLAWLAAPNDNWFIQGFVQLDVAVQGDGFRVSDPLLFGQLSGDIQGQTLLRSSAGVGRWFFRHPDKTAFRGLSGIVEIHVTSTLNDADSITHQGMFTARSLGNRENQQTFVNLTSGLHLEVTKDLDARVAASVPLRREDRSQDASVLFQITLHY